MNRRNVSAAMRRAVRASLWIVPPAMMACGTSGDSASNGRNPGSSGSSSSAGGGRDAGSSANASGDASASTNDFHDASPIEFGNTNSSSSSSYGSTSSSSSSGHSSSSSSSSSSFLDDAAAPKDAEPPIVVGACAVAKTPLAPFYPVLSGSCSTSYAYSGSAAACGVDDAGFVDILQCQRLCPLDRDGSALLSCAVVPTNPTSGRLDCVYEICVPFTGRRPEGLRPRGDGGGASASCPHGASATAGLLASAAYLEAASVHAFRHMARELRTHGAPARLRAAALRAARDEVRHARVMTGLAERAGASVEGVRITTVPARSLEAMARENAVEGCVRETYGAAVAHVQAVRARDPRVRAALERIASDETRHAELSWQVARWIEGRLAPAERRRVRSARAQAVASLARAVGAMPDGPEIDELGLPTRAQASALVAELRTTLWDARPRARRNPRTVAARGRSRRVMAGSPRSKGR